MRTQILPNWGKKLGLVFFIIASFINGGINYFKNSTKSYRGVGINTADLESRTNDLMGLLNAFTGGAFFIFKNDISILAIIGMLIYMLSKEKIEDDYINKLRLESFQLTTIIGLLIAIILFIIFKDLKLTLNYFIFPFIWSYLILFFIKRKMYL